MPTNDERREVAARLRELADENTVTATNYLVREVFKELGAEPPASPSNPTLRDLEAYDQAFLYRLADLIEPEPERTCELIRHAARDEESGIELVLYECGQCGWIVDPSRNERYCPNCGAKVVE